MIKKLTYKKLRLLFYIGILGVLWNCKSNDIVDGKKYNTEIATLETLLEKEAYYIDIEVVYPFNTAATTQVLNDLLVQRTGNNAARIDVRGEGNFIEIQNDSVKGYLPFFGERRLSAGAYNGRDGSIGFEGVPEDYGKTINKGKKKLEINFKTNQNDESTESYNVSLQIFPSNKVDVNISSAYKTFMRYRGTLKPVEAESQ